MMQKRKIDELIYHFNRKVADMDIDMEYKMELLGMITAIGIACEKELSIEPERKTGKWLERHHAYADEEKVIEEWQSCKCSVCGRYDTRPYLYYFSEPRFCSWCGADMRGEGHE